MVHVFVEGKSDQAFLEGWLPRAFSGHSFKMHPHMGKGKLPVDSSSQPLAKHQGLLDQLPAKLRAFAKSPGRSNLGILVLVDADNDNCIDLKRKLVEILNDQAPGLNVVFRIAVEESEAFYLGDLRALKKAYPHSDMSLAMAYQPDSICDTAELFGKIIDDQGMSKVAWGETMGRLVTIYPKNSRSPSFRALHAGFMKLTAVKSVGTTTRPKKFRHVPRTARSRR